MYTLDPWPEVVSEVPHNPESLYQSGYVIATQSNRNNPAYLTLEVPPLVHFHLKFQECIIETKTTEGPKKVVSSSLLLRSGLFPESAIQGPSCNKTIDIDISFNMSTDDVPCLVSPLWPKCALDFLSRPRPRDWPSKELLDRIEQAGCHVVAIGHPRSDNKDAEWRWSFSVAEKELTLTLTNLLHSVHFTSRQPVCGCVRLNHTMSM